MFAAKSVALAIGLFLGTAVPATALATTALLLTDREQARLSTAVVIATVGLQSVAFDEELKTTVTHTSLNVLEVVYGEAPATVSVAQVGGQLGNRIVTLPGDAKLRRGELCVLFLLKNQDGWFLTALQQSKYQLHGDREGTPVLTRTLGEGILQRNLEGQLIPIHEASKTSTSSLERFRVLMESVSDDDTSAP